MVLSAAGGLTWGLATMANMTRSETIGTFIAMLMGVTIIAAIIMFA